MPVLESPELLYRESRVQTLEGISRTVDKYRERVLALRLGVTDFCSSYGLRRAPDMTAWDVQIVASVISDVVNMLGRADGTGFTVTGPVWEYFRVQERMFKPQLRRSPFLEGQAEELREALIEHSMDGLLREITLARPTAARQDLHPPLPRAAGARAVGGQSAEFSDAQDILRPDRGGGGVLRSAYTNKMNEVKPHRAWAERTMLRAEVLGVANEDIGFVELLAAGIPA
ncbi:ATP/GTP-binding protein OS=Streptomyces alboniger OX=132473 GN=CP975_10600 PE=4 SV=1 [Streptomyces alboniger]